MATLAFPKQTVYVPAFGGRTHEQGDGPCLQSRSVKRHELWSPRYPQPHAGYRVERADLHAQESLSLSFKRGSLWDEMQKVVLGSVAVLHGTWLQKKKK